VSDGVLIGIIAAAVTLIPTALGALWKWSQAVEQRAYERARNEALLREATAALAAKDRELESVKAQLAHQVEVEVPRLHGIIATLQGTIDWLTAEGAS
jgi:hypothetical protein